MCTRTPVVGEELALFTRPARKKKNLSGDRFCVSVSFRSRQGEDGGMATEREENAKGSCHEELGVNCGFSHQL